MGRPSFLITIDTEGDNLWSRPRTITCANAKFLPRFQSLCESYGLKPTYLTSYEMVKCREFQELGEEVVRRGTGEVGMHLHAWNCPPLVPLTSDDSRYQPYLVEYAEDIMWRKIDYITKSLEDAFGVKMKSHRAGRWSLNEVYARILVEKGYLVDCSVTPHVSWRRIPGDPGGIGGSDYSDFPATPYLMNLKDISRSGDSPLLEVPVTIMGERNGIFKKIRSFYGDRSVVQRLLN